MNSLGIDVRYAMRMLKKTPGITLVIVFSLALGIGANTAIFTLINAVMLKRLPVENPERLALFGDGLHRGFISGGGSRLNIFSYPLFKYFQSHNPAFQDTCAYRTEMDRLHVRVPGNREAGEVRLAWGRVVSGNYFSVLGVKPLWGRSLNPLDDQPGAAPVSVISYRCWQRDFDFSPSIIGQALEINRLMVTVVGIAPPEFFGESIESGLPDFWLPTTMQPAMMKDRGPLLENHEIFWLNLIGRLKPGISLEQANSATNLSLRQYLTSIIGPGLSPGQQRDVYRRYISLSSGSRGVSNLRFLYSQPLHILMATVALVLLIACANVANILLARAVVRTREISLRLALGASRLRLVRQLLIESLILAFLGSGAGIIIAYWGVNGLVGMVAGESGILALKVSPDVRILGFTMTVTLLAALLFGLVPALRAARVDLIPALKETTIGSRHGGRSRLSKLLVVGQVSMSLLLVVGAGLFIRTLKNLEIQDYGFKQERVLEVGIDPRIAGFKQSQLNGLYQALLDHVQAIPGVHSASLSLYSPLSGNNWSGQISVEGYFPPPKEPADAQWVWVGPRYAETVGMSLLMGRDLSQRDTAGTPLVAVVNECFVKNYLPDQNPIGSRISMNDPADTYETEIVGVVKDFKFNEPRQKFRPIVLLPLAQATGPESYAANLEVRTQGNPLSVAASVRRTIRGVDKNLPITGIHTLSEQIHDSVRIESNVAWLSTFFGGLALLLSCIGIYGIISFGVACRTREIGIRMALGAQRKNILLMILQEASLLILLGATLGLIGAIGTSRLLTSYLYGLTALDPLTYGMAVLIVTVVGFLAGSIPSRRASKVDPLVALRYE
jgi:predicted permease